MIDGMQAAAAGSSDAAPSRRLDGPAPAAAYRELRARVEGALGPAADAESHARVLERRMRLFMVLQISELLVLVYAPWWPLKVACAVVFAVYRARTIWTVIHERVHRRELPSTVAKLFYDFSTAFIVRLWKRHHLQHHAHTNTPRDPDTRMFFGRDLNDARLPRARGLRRPLGFLTTLAQYPFLFVLFIVRSLATYRGGNIGFYLASIVVYGAILSLVLPREAARLNFVANFSIGAVYVLFTFAPTHSASRANFELAGDPLIDQLVATNNVWPRSRLWSFFCGGINLHIEHHLFPHVPWHELPRIAPVVEEFARERDLPYNAYSPLAIWRAHLRFLWRSS